MNHTILTRPYESPCGQLLLGSWGPKLCLCDWPSHQAQKRLARVLHTKVTEGNSEATDRAAQILDAYFSGQHPRWDVPLLLAGTAFQQSVWRELLTIPWGTTISYGELARRLHKPRAVRAVANAVGANALSIFVPCHRIIGSAQSLTGYAGGLPAKHFLLTHEALWKLGIRS